MVLISHGYPNENETSETVPTDMACSTMLLASVDLSRRSRENELMFTYCMSFASHSVYKNRMLFRHF